MVNMVINNGDSGNEPLIVKHGWEIPELNGGFVRWGIIELNKNMIHRCHVSQENHRKTIGKP